MTDSRHEPRMSGTEMTQSQGGRSPFSSTNLGHEEAFQGLESLGAQKSTPLAFDRWAMTLGKL